MRRVVAGSLLFLWAVSGPAYAEATNPAVKAAEEKQLQAHPLNLTCVRLTGGPLKHAQDLDAKYLLELEPDRMMAGYRLARDSSLRPRLMAAGTLPPASN